MTSINSISSNSSIPSLSQIGQRNGMQPPPPPPEGEGHGKDGGGLLGAIDSALKSAGIEGGLESIFGQSGTSSTTSTDGTETTESSDSSTDAASALNSFLQNLISTLQSQGTTDTSSEDSTDASSTTEASTTQGMPPPPPYGGHGMEAKLQSLISSLTNSDSDDSTTSDSAGSDLENSFKSLVSALGGDSDSTSLSGFLQALSTSMQHRGPTGNVVSTTA
jgi:hypothetical protein